MVIAFCNIYFGLVANCDKFSFILMFYIICHISIFIFEITICDLKRIVTYCCMQSRTFSL